MLITPLLKVYLVSLYKQLKYIYVVNLDFV